MYVMKLIKHKTIGVIVLFLHLLSELDFYLYRFIFRMKIRILPLLFHRPGQSVRNSMVKQILIWILYKIIGILFYFIGVFVCMHGIFFILDSLIPKEKKVSIWVYIVEMIVGICVYPDRISYL